MGEMHPLIRKALALTLLLGVLAGLWYGGAEPLYVRYVAQEESIDRTARLLLRYGQINAAGEGLADALKRVRAESRAAGYFLAGESVELAGAQIQERIKSIVEGGGGKLRSTQMLAATEEEDGRRLGLRVHMEGDIEVLQRVLHDMEGMTPYLFVAKLNIQASPGALRRSRARRRRRRGRRMDPNQLQVRFDLHVYMTPETG